MFAALLPAIVGTLVSTSSGIAIDSLTKLVTPPTIKALTGFGIKAGSAIVGGIVSMKISEFAVKRTEEIIEIVNKVPEVEAAPEEAVPEEGIFGKHTENFEKLKAARIEANAQKDTPKKDIPKKEAPKTEQE